MDRRPPPPRPGAFETVYELSFGRRNAPRPRPGSVGFRRDWTELVELLLDGRLEAADQTAWLRFGTRPRRVVTTGVAGFVARQQDRLRRMLEPNAGRADLGPRERAVLERFQLEVQSRLENEDVTGAAELLRRLPFPPR